MATVVKPIVLDETMRELLSMIDGIKSVNGLTGDVVLDGNNLKINARSETSKTLKEAFSMAGSASAELIEGTTDDYVMTVTNGIIS